MLHVQGSGQILVGGLGIKNAIFIVQPCFYTQNTQFSIFFQLLWWAPYQSAGCGRPALPTVGRTLAWQYVGVAVIGVYNSTSVANIKRYATARQTIWMPGTMNCSVHLFGTEYACDV